MSVASSQSHSIRVLYREFFRALSNETRFAIVTLLRSEPCSVNGIAEALKYEQSRVSHNLACLANCGFVTWEWSGKSKMYRLNPDLSPVLTGIEKHLLRYAPALEGCEILAQETRPVALSSVAAKPKSPSVVKTRRSA